MRDVILEFNIPEIAYLYLILLNLNLSSAIDGLQILSERLKEDLKGSF